VLLRVATTKPVAAAAEKKGPKQQPGKQQDTEALAVWDSALTKYDSPEASFEKGMEAKKAMEALLVTQVTDDLIKDYDVKPSDAQQRATKVVMAEMGKRFGAWKAKQKPGGY